MFHIRRSLVRRFGTTFPGRSFARPCHHQAALSALPIAWFALWVCGDWRHRRSLLGGFAATLGALTLGSEYLLPGWFLRYPAALRAYADYTGATSLLGVLLPTTFAWIVSISALLVAAQFCWRARRQPANSRTFAIALCFALTLTVLIVPSVLPPFNHVLVLPVVLRNDSPLERPLANHPSDLFHRRRILGIRISPVAPRSRPSLHAFRAAAVTVPVVAPARCQPRTPVRCFRFPASAVPSGSDPTDFSLNAAADGCTRTALLQPKSKQQPTGHGFATLLERHCSGFFGVATGNEDSTLASVELGRERRDLLMPSAFWGSGSTTKTLRLAP